MRAPRKYRVTGCPGGDGSPVRPAVEAAVQSGALSPRAGALLEGFRCGEVVTSTVLAKRAAEGSGSGGDGAASGGGDGAAAQPSYPVLLNRALDAIKAAEAAGILECISEAPSITLAEFVEIPSVRYWLKILSASNHRHDVTHKGLTGTRRTYASRLYKFHGWLAGRTVALARRHPAADGAGGSAMARASFRQVELGGVDDLLALYLEPDADTRELNKVAKEFLSEIRDDRNLSTSSLKSAESALRSYFETHEAAYSARFPVRRARSGGPSAVQGEEEWEDAALALGDLAAMLTTGQPTILDKSVLLSMFHRGLDRATLADRFNFTAFDQVSAHMGTDDPRGWSLEKCPVPVVLARVKTEYKHMGFLERDAVLAMQEWVYERERRTGRRLRRGCGEPMYVMRGGGPVKDVWVGRRFATLALRAGLAKQSASAGRMPSRHLHQLRKLLKSTLIDAGCRMDVADHVIGHAPKDAYEVQASLYPDSLRREFAKAAGRLNIFTRIASIIGGNDAGCGAGCNAAALQADLREMNARIDRISGEYRLLLARCDRMDEVLRRQGGWAEVWDAKDAAAAASAQAAAEAMRSAAF